MISGESRVLLVEPAFPIPTKSKNHKNFLPVGLLKIASFQRALGNNVLLFRGVPRDSDSKKRLTKFNPDEIWITSLFTYWSCYVKETVEFYKEIFPNAKITVGGIYASLRPEKEVISYTGCDEVFQGVMNEAEQYSPAYDLLESKNGGPIDYQILHASRGCIRNCQFCGTWIIEPEYKPKRSIAGEILQGIRKLVFYDNNLLANPYIEDILAELAELKRVKRILWCESQSGFDGRILKEKPHLGRMLKKAGFQNPRIAWDWGYKQHESIKQQIDLLLDAGYKSNQVYVFVIYNWDTTFEEMEQKRIRCYEWQVQIADCRYRPLDQMYDHYNGRAKNQTNADYYIHEEAGWTDALVKQFRRNIREQNICIRYGFPFYSRSFEHKSQGKEVRRQVKLLPTLIEKKALLRNIGADFWVPDSIRYPKEYNYAQQQIVFY